MSVNSQLTPSLDRGNAGNAKLQGLLTILGDNADHKFSVILSMFYVTYIVSRLGGSSNTDPTRRSISLATFLAQSSRPTMHLPSARSSGASLLRLKPERTTMRP